ncbi:MAG: hypothetical protein ACYSW7_05995 [Planctomycetota bacterium]|jgi:prepilin-type processing-associated H-X9-DG protein
MSETETNAQSKKPKVSKLAILSPLLVISGFFIGLVFPGWLKRYHFLARIDLWTYMLSLLAGLIAGIIADYKIYKSKGLLTGRVFSVSGTILALILIVAILIPHRHPRRELALRIICNANLKCLSVAIQFYTSDYDNKYPIADKWCDLLLKYGETREEWFVCKGALKKCKKESCHYAINPNCEPNSPPDMVLLFETKAGWNQFGGPEILTLENHNGKGCNVLFNDGHREFVKTEQLGQLKWGVEERDEKLID